MTSNAEHSERGFRRWHWHFWFAIALWSVLFLVHEGLRIRRQGRILSITAKNQAVLAERFPALGDAGPSLFPRVGEWLGGGYWNSDIVAIEVYGDSANSDNGPIEEGLLTDFSKLQRLYNLQIRYADLTPKQIRQLAGMKQLRWLLLVGTNLDAAAIDRLRTSLPNTFVTAL